MAGARAAAQRVILPETNTARFLAHLLLDLKHWVQKVWMVARKVDKPILCDAMARLGNHLVNIQLQAHTPQINVRNESTSLWQQ